jgi:preprotein translocase subunit SecD
MKSLAAAALVAVLLAAACSSEDAPQAAAPQAAAPKPPCDISLVALPPGSDLTAGQPIPPGSQVVARPDDFDRAATTLEDAGDGTHAVTLHLRGAAIDTFATHTRNHVGDMVAILVNGKVVVVPMIQEAITNGEIRLAGPTADDAEFVSRLAVCVP